MVIQKRYCDRCRKEIDENYEELSLGSDLNYELCNDCYYSIHDIVSLWLTNTRPCDNCQHSKESTNLFCRVSECNITNNYRNFKPMPKEEKEEEK